MAAPTLTSSAISTWSDNVNTDEVTATLTWNSGDRILVVGMTEDQGFVLATPTATGLTFSALGTAITVANSCWLHVWTATAGSSGSSAITASRATSTGVAMRGLAAFAYGSCTGFARTNKGGGSGAVNSTQVVSITRTQANSAIVVVIGDWSAGSVAGIGWTPAGQTQLVAQTNTGAAAAVARWGDQGATGTSNYGSTGMAGNAFTVAGVEVLGTVSSSTTANAEVATAAGTANNPVAAVGPAAEAATGAGSAQTAVGTATFFSNADVTGTGETSESEVWLATEFTVPAGTVNSFRWWFPAGVIGVTPVVRLFNAGGTAQAIGPGGATTLSFDGTPVAGQWNNATPPAPIALAAGTYRVVVNTTRYVFRLSFFTSSVVRNGVTGVQSRFGAPGSAPNTTSTATYFIDLGFNANAATTASADNAAGTGAANNATAGVVAQAEVATAAGAANNATAGVVVQAEVASAAGAANNAAVSTGGGGGSESLFTSQTPVMTDQSDGTPGITTATTVRFAVAGEVTAARFYATATVSGTYTVGLWRVDSSDPGGGTLLASKTLAGAPTGGAWNTVTFDSPVSVLADTAYRVGVFSSAGRYVATSGFFTGADLVNGNITADQPGDTIGAVTISQGTFRIDSVFEYPNTSGGGASYFTDVVFSVAGAATSAPAENAAGGGTAYDAGAALVVAAEAATATGDAYAATVQTSTATTASAQNAAAAGSAGDAGVAVVVAAGVATAAGAANNASVLVPGGVESLFTSQVPDTGNNSDGTPGITVGTTMRFASDGVVTGIRFYCTANTGGTWTGALYQVEASDPGSGTALAVKVMGVTPTGSTWNTITFDSPVAVTAGTAYRAALHNSEGRYVATVGFFATDLVNGSITADADGDTVGGYTISQGTFRIDAAMGYPNGTAGSANYFVDVTYMVSSATVANAECATASGAALFDAGTQVSLTLISDAPVEAVGTAYAATVVTSVTVAAGVATATAAAADATASVAVPSGAAAAAGAAANATAAAAGSAQNAAATGTAYNAGTAVVVAAEAATAAGAANQPAVQTSVSGTAAAGEATAAATAADASTAITVTAATATATGTAHAAAATGSATTTAAPEPAIAAAAAPSPAVAVVASAEAATVTADAHPATVSTFTGTVAAAQAAVAAAEAFDTSVTLVALADLAAATAAANDAAVSTATGVTVSAECASASGTAWQAGVVVVQPQVFAYPHRVVRTGTYASVRRSQ